MGQRQSNMNDYDNLIESTIFSGNQEILLMILSDVEENYNFNAVIRTCLKRLLIETMIAYDILNCFLLLLIKDKIQLRLTIFDDELYSLFKQYAEYYDFAIIGKLLDAGLLLIDNTVINPEFYHRILSICQSLSPVINAVDSELNTPLHLAVRRKNEKLIRLLTMAKADDTLQNKQGKTAQDLADPDSTISKLLTEYHQKRFPNKALLCAIYERNNSHAVTAISNKANVEYIGPSPNPDFYAGNLSPLQLAYLLDSQSIADYLLSFIKSSDHVLLTINMISASYNEKPDDEKVKQKCLTWFKLIIFSDHKTDCTQLRHFNLPFAAFSLLQKLNQDTLIKKIVTAKYKNGQTYLHRIASERNSQQLALTLDLGVDPETKDTTGKSPADIIRASNHTESIKVLDDHLQQKSYKALAEAIKSSNVSTINHILQKAKRYLTPLVRRAITSPDNHLLCADNNILSALLFVSGKRREIDFDDELLTSLQKLSQLDLIIRAIQAPRVNGKKNLIGEAIDRNDYAFAFKLILLEISTKTNAIEPETLLALVRYFSRREWKSHLSHFQKFLHQHIYANLNDEFLTALLADKVLLAFFKKLKLREACYTQLDAKEKSIADEAKQFDEMMQRISSEFGEKLLHDFTRTFIKETVKEVRVDIQKENENIKIALPIHHEHVNPKKSKKSQPLVTSLKANSIFPPPIPSVKANPAPSEWLTPIKVEVYTLQTLHDKIQTLLTNFPPTADFLAKDVRKNMLAQFSDLSCYTDKYNKSNPLPLLSDIHTTMSTTHQALSAIQENDSEENNDDQFLHLHNLSLSYVRALQKVETMSDNLKNHISITRLQLKK